jgi:opacity protein-like surface antigen
MKLLLTILSILTLANFAHAEGPKEDTFKLGAMFGNVALKEDAGQSKNAIGVGGIFGYSLADELSFEIDYLQSTHDDLKSSNIGLGVNYYFNSYEPFYYSLTGGVAFTTNKYDSAGTSADDTAFGLFIGAGADVFTKRNLIVGLQARYYKMFGSDVKIGSDTYTLVDDYVTILARVMFQF